MNTPYAYAIVQGEDGRENVSLQFDHPEMCGQKYNAVIPLFTQEQLEEARKLGMQQERALWNLSESTQEIMNTHPHSEESVKVKELRDEEILNEWILTSYNPKTYVWADDTDDDLVLQFARAILRKAQEK